MLKTLENNIIKALSGSPEGTKINVHNDMISATFIEDLKKQFKVKIEYDAPVYTITKLG